MLISQTSPFRNIPTVIEPKQVIYFDGIKASVDIVDLCFNRLKDSLYKATFESDKIELHTTPLIFSDCWSIISNLTIFINILEELGISEDDPLLKKLRVVKLLRHTNQHLDERIGEVLFEKELPILGYLSWYAQKDTNSNDGIISTLYSGFITNKQNVNFAPDNPSGKLNNEIINDIELTSVIRVGNKFENYTVNIIELISETEKVIDFFEKQLIPQFDAIKEKQFHVSEMIVRILVYKLNTEESII